MAALWIVVPLSKNVTLISVMTITTMIWNPCNVVNLSQAISDVNAIIPPSALKPANRKMERKSGTAQSGVANASVSNKRGNK